MDAQTEEKKAKKLSHATIIGISGKQFSGKDALTKILLEKLSGFQQVPLALAIKEAYAKDNDMTLEDIEKHKAFHRPGLIAKGDWGRAQDADYWIKQVLATPGKKVISDVRLKREYDLLKEQGAFLIRLEADRDVRWHRGTLVKEDDPTECDLDDVKAWDAVLYNNASLDMLDVQVENLLTQ